MSAILYTVRTILYYVLFFFGFLTFVLAAAVTGMLNNDFGGYLGSGAELIVAGLLVLIVLVPWRLLAPRRFAGTVINSVLVEMILLGVLWLLFLGGAAAFSNSWTGVICFGGNSLCGTSRALQAFAWLSWVTLSALLALAVFAVVVSRRITEPFTLERGGPAPSTNATGVAPPTSNVKLEQVA